MKQPHNPVSMVLAQSNDNMAVTSVIMAERQSPSLCQLVNNGSRE